MSLTAPPDRYSAAPVVTWMIPSQPASAKPRIVPLSVSEEVDVDRRQRVAAGRCGIEHRRVLLSGRDHQAAIRSPVTPSSGMLKTFAPSSCVSATPRRRSIQPSTWWLSLLTYATKRVMPSARARSASS